jgi:hypothetical protein
VRRGGENDSWLVHANLNPPKTRAGWFETSLLDVETSQMATITLTSANDAVIPLNVKDGEVSIDASVIGDRIPAQNKLDRITGLFESLDFIDVRRADNAEDETSEGALVAMLTDGTSISVSAIEAYDESGLWVRIGAEGGSDFASKLTAKFDGFEFALSSIDADIIGWSLDDMTEPAPS